LLGLHLVLLAGCADGDTAPSGVDDDDGARSAAAEPIRWLDVRDLPPELAAELLSDEPIPPPMEADRPEPAFDARAAYVRWLRESRTVVLLVTIEELTPSTYGSVARVEVLGSSSADFDRTEILIPNGLGCEGIEDVRAGETIVVHVSPAQLAKPDRAFVPISTTIGGPTLARVARDGQNRPRVRYPWGDESFETVVEDIGGRR
jgi:hypothetical protein